MKMNQNKEYTLIVVIALYSLSTSRRMALLTLYCRLLICTFSRQM